MARKFVETELLLATKNQGKVEELRRSINRANLSIDSAVDVDCVEPEETGTTFIENAILKASYYGKHTNKPALADDSGLCVSALNNAPGIYSARWAGPNKDFNIAMETIRNKIETVASDDYSAKFVCALALYWPEDDHVESFEGEVHGTLTFPPRGDQGFGYDPIFVPNGFNMTFAQMEHSEKEKLSHRSNALAQLIKECF